MLSSAQTFRFIGILSVLTVLNVTFLGLTWTRKDNIVGCSMENVLEGMTRYIQGTGARQLAEVMAEPCIRSVTEMRSMESVADSVRGLVSVCRKMNETRKRSRKLRNPIITLFTTWGPSNDTEKFAIHKRTLRNWASFMPKVDIVVFTNSSHDAKLAQEFGAKVLPVIEHRGGGSPVLRWMFETVKKDHIISTLYGYVNSDILFTDKLISTLEAIIKTRSMKEPVFIVGRRINVKGVSYNETVTYKSIETIAKQRGELFGANAEDFFITNAAFPWPKIIDVVVGRLAYDNWIVGHVICDMKIDVIDVTDTVTAVHQTSEAGGNFEGFKSQHAHYNNGLFKSLGIHPKFQSGFTICAPERTFLSLCNVIQIVKRTEFWDECACPVPNITALAG